MTLPSLLAHAGIPYQVFGRREGAVVVTISWIRLAIARSFPFISPTLASRSFSPSALFFSAFNSAARSFIAAFSSAENPVDFFSAIRCSFRGRRESRLPSMVSGSCESRRAKLTICLPGRRLGQPAAGLVPLEQLEQAQLAWRQPAERARAVPDPVLLGDERHPLPGRAVLQAHRAGRSQVIPERCQVETLEVVRQLEVDVQLLTALERRVDRLHQLPVLVAGDLAGRAKAECSGW